MNVTRKDATITNTDEEFPGTFEVILSTADEDRDGESLDQKDWELPLPQHITFDMDHGMSVEKTVGSGVPSIEDGKLIVRGTYSSLDRAQQVRTLVKEGHIRTTSVAFMTKKVTKAGGKQGTVRELLNGAFVAIPSNREALVVASKSIPDATEYLRQKAGARNSQTDQSYIQTAHDALVSVGATCGPEDESGAADGAMGGKAYSVFVKAKYSSDELAQMLKDGHAIANDSGDPSYPIGDTADLTNAIHAVGRGGSDHDKIRAYIIARAKDLSASDGIPDNWNADGSLKTISDVTTKDTAQLVQAIDASLGEGWNLLADTDQKSLPDNVRQALGLFATAGATVDELLEAMNVTEETTPPAKSADEDALTLKMRALELAALAG